MSVSVFNRCWSKVILETLVRQGVSHFCIAPGSRSTPLTLEAVRLQNASRATCHSHFDERGLGFFALGIAKSTQAPVAVIVTSGTASANLYPAIIEARQTGVNLIILTADRPPEIVGVWRESSYRATKYVCRLPRCKCQSTETSGRLCSKMVNFYVRTSLL